MTDDMFAAHLQWASQIVATWPEWKRNALQTIQGAFMSTTDQDPVATSAALDWVDLVGEKSRTYIFSQRSLTVENVVRICVRSSGTHRLETASGEKLIVAPGWLMIRITAETWSL